MGELFVISLGGSLIVPRGIDHQFLTKFRSLIEKEITKGHRFILICGGGRTARNYQDSAKHIGALTRDDLDWLGIHSTRLNAHLLRTIFRKHAHRHIVKNPMKKTQFKENILIAAGWKPGRSTDYVAVILAQQFKATTLLNLSNIKQVYTKDPKIHSNAQPLKELTWKEFRPLVGNHWDPGLNAPFDPVAAKEAQKNGLKVIIAGGKDLNNLKNIISGKPFVGTTIQ